MSTPSPVKEAAANLGIPVSHDVDDVLETAADLAVVVAFGEFIKPRVLDGLAMVNMHFSLLPRWRGAAPVERALLAGDEVTGVCVMELAEELDVGDVYRRAEVPIRDDVTLDVLRTELVGVGTELLVSALKEGLGTPTPQTGEVTWASKVTSAELELAWHESAVQLHRVVRLGDAWTTVEGRRLKVWAASVSGDLGLAPGELRGTSVGTGAGTLELIEVQPEGKGRRSASEWLNGARLPPEQRLGS